MQELQPAKIRLKWWFSSLQCWRTGVSLPAEEAALPQRAQQREVDEYTPDSLEDPKLERPQARQDAAEDWAEDGAGQADNVSEDWADREGGEPSDYEAEAMDEEGRPAGGVWL